MAHTKSKNNAFLTTPKNNWRDKIDVEIGDTKQPQFYPQVKVSRWDNESNISIRHINHGEHNPKVVHEGEKVKWVGSKREAHFYELPHSLEHPEGATELEIILNEKPETNIVEFSISSKDAKFLYQPELTEAEIEAGATRPENAIGSYAIYSTTSKINILGKKEYKAGKIGHIYRPWIVDTNNNGVWGSLSLDVNGDSGNGTLTVTIPQEFLDTAAYPVRHAAGLTLGYTSVGASNLAWSANYVSVFPPQTTAASTLPLEMVSMYCSPTGSFANMRLGVYKVSDGSLIGQSDSTTKAAGAAWVDCVTNTHSNIVSGTDYRTAGTWEENINAYYDSDGGTDPWRYQSQSYDVLPSSISFPFMATYGLGPTSVYATYATSPSITETGSLSDYGSIVVGSSSSDQTFTVSGTNLLANIVITAPTDFQVSVGGGYLSSVSLSPSSGTISTTTVYARFSPTSAGAKSGNIAITSPAATTQNVAVSGTGLSSGGGLRPFF